MAKKRDTQLINMRKKLKKAKVEQYRNKEVADLYKSVFESFYNDLMLEFSDNAVALHIIKEKRAETMRRYIMERTMEDDIFA